MDKHTKKILVVDDDKQASMMLEEYLNRLGEKVCIASNGQEALLAFDRFHPDLIILDLHMPQMDGFNFAREIRKVSNCPIFVISGNIGTHEDLKRVIDLDVNDVIEKPFNLQSLTAKIRHYMESRTQEEYVQSLEEELDQARAAERELMLMNKHLRQMVARDVGTQLFNKRYFVERLKSEFSRAKRYLTPLSMIMVDIDYFKSINEAYGHPFGDSILREFASFLAEMTRISDIPARYGGEEFAILLPNTTLVGAIRFAENFIQKLSAKVFDEKDKKITIEASLGICAYPEQEAVDSITFIKQADIALQQAKAQEGGHYAVYHVSAEEDLEGFFEEGGKEQAAKLKSKIERIAKRVNHAVTESICAFAKSMKAKDQYSSSSVEQSVHLVERIAEIINVSPQQKELVKQAALLHDLGKVGIDNKILLKKGHLTEAEIAVIRKHPTIGAEILRPIHFLKDLVDIILFHHERFDGKGYPAGLCNHDIPMEARIIAVVDVYQALRANRPYRQAFSKEQARTIIREGSGTQFDPKVVRAFLKVCDAEDI